MRVRIQRKRRSRTRTDIPHAQHLALLLAAVTTPTALLAFTMALWKIGADLRLTGPFVMSAGVFSHWQTWLGIAGALFLLTSALNRFGRGAGTTPYEARAASRSRG